MEFMDTFGNTYMLSMSGRNRHSEENMPQQTYDQSCDCESDIECSKKDDEIKWFRKENYGLKLQIRDMEDVIENNDIAIDEQKGHLAKVTQELAKEMLDRHHLNSMETTRINGLIESNTNKDLTIKLLNTQNINLIETINQKMAEMEDMTNEYEIIESKADKYRNKVRDLKSEIQRINKELEDMNTKNQKQKEKIQKLKKSRKYHEDDKNHHKQKVVAVSHTAIKQQEVYANAITKVNMDNMMYNHNMFEGLIDFMRNLQNESKRKMSENCDNSYTDVINEMDNTYKKQRKMEEKRADGRKSCGSCPKTFANMKGLRTHLTVTHKMNTTDISKNKPQIFQNY